MVTKEHTEHQKALHRAVYNDWGLYGFVQMLTYKWRLSGKVLEIQDESHTSKTCSRCGRKQPMPQNPRTYRCQNCGLVMDRDENSAVNHYQRFFARLGPHTGDPVRCAAEAGGGVAVAGTAQVQSVQQSIRLNTF